MAYDTNNREPLFYEEYPGSTNDVSQLRQMVGKAKGYGYKHIGFILDRGYFDRKNFTYMDKCGYSFVIMVKGMKALVRDMILEKKGTFERKRSCYIHEHGVAGTTIKRKMYESDDKERYFHLFYSVSRENRERAVFEENLKKMREVLKKNEGKECRFKGLYEEYYDLFYHEVKEKVKVIGKADTQKEEEREIVKEIIFLFAKEKEDVVEAEIELMGYFAIVTSDKMTASEALELYSR